MYKTCNFQIVVLTILSTAILYSYGCSEHKESDISDYTPMQFISLSADTTILIPGGSTKIHARAIGTGLCYFWTASAGNIAGSGSEVTYIAPPCTLGQNTIECTVKDSKNISATKSIIITVQ